MVVGAVQASFREALHQPVEQGLVAGVHPERDLRLLPVAAERTLANEQSDDHASIEIRELRHEWCSTWPVVRKLFHRRKKRETGTCHLVRGAVWRG